MVAAALDILRWAAGPLPLDRVSALLLSPHFAAGSEADTELLARAEFDAFALRNRISPPTPALARRALLPRLALEARRRSASPAQASSNPPLHLRRENLTTRDRSYADWAAAFQELLDIASWAPPAHLDSVEFQARRKWESALDELAALDFDAPANPARIPFQAALTALTHIAAETLFAPESRHAPIQIMGALESAGSGFDAIWFLRAGDLSWPSAPSTNPLLPWLLQREHTMPGADPAHDTAHARRITGRIAASAPTVLFSYALHTMKGRQRPSPVLAALHLSPRACSQVAPAEPAPVPIALDAFADDAPIPAPPGDTPARRRLHPRGPGRLRLPRLRRAPPLLLHPRRRLPRPRRPRARQPRPCRPARLLGRDWRPGYAPTHDYRQSRRAPHPMHPLRPRARPLSPRRRLARRIYRRRARAVDASPPPLARLRGQCASSLRREVQRGRATGRLHRPSPPQHPRRPRRPGHARSRPHAK